MDDYVHRYPPFPKGIPVVPIESLLEGQQALIQQIICSRGLAGFHNRAEAERLIVAPITHFAQWVHLLPASENSYFRTPGGLFRFGLENALFAIRYAERSILTRETPEIRKETERLWTHASFLAGLVSESILTLSKIAVYSDGGEAWHPGVEPLHPWLIRHRVKNYHISWLNKEDRAMAVAIAGKTIPPEQAQILANGEKSILSTLMTALYCMEDLGNPLVKINQSVRYKLIERDLAADSSRYGKPMAGMHLEPWLIDAMRHLLLNRHWLVNIELGRVWYGTDGVYLLWPLAANDIRQELKQTKCPFVPNTTDIVAEMMLDAGIIVHNGNLSGFVFDIAIPQGDQPERKSVTAIRLKRPEILFGERPVQALEMILAIGRVALADTEDRSDWLEVRETDVSMGNDPIPPTQANKQKPLGQQAKDSLPTRHSQPESAENRVETTSIQDRAEDNPDLASADTNDYDALYAAQYEFDNVGEAVHPVTSREPATSPAITQQDRIDALLNTPPTAIPSFAKPKKTNTTVDQDVLAKLRVINKPSVPVGLLQARLPMLLERLKKIPPEYACQQSDGITKINTQGLQKMKLDLKDCLEVLKAGDLLVLVDGAELGIEQTQQKQIRYFLVKGDIRGA